MSSDIAQESVQDYLASLAAKTSTPGGGSAVALTGAQGIALLAMVLEYTADSPEQLVQRCTAARTDFLKYAQQDVDAFSDVMSWYQKDKLSEEYQSALRRAVDVPLLIMGEAAKFADAAEYLAVKGNQNLITDVGIGALLLATTINGALVNVHINLESITDDGFNKAAGDKAGIFLGSAERLSQVHTGIQDKLTQ